MCHGTTLYIIERARRGWSPVSPHRSDDLHLQEGQLEGEGQIPPLSLLWLRWTTAHLQQRGPGEDRPLLLPVSRDYQRTFLQTIRGNEKSLSFYHFILIFPRKSRLETALPKIGWISNWAPMLRSSISSVVMMSHSVISSKSETSQSSTAKRSN